MGIYVTKTSTTTALFKFPVTKRTYVCTWEIHSITIPQLDVTNT